MTKETTKSKAAAKKEANPETTNQQMAVVPAVSLQAINTNIELLEARIKEAELTARLDELAGKRGKLNVHQAIAEVIKQVDKVYKKGKNESQGYTYTMAADVMEACRMAVAEVGITIIPLGVTNKTTGGKSGQIQFGTMEYKVYGPDGSYEIVPIDSAGQDYGDKGPFKFMTGALKYLFIQLFLLPQGLDPESEKLDTPAPKEAANTSNQNTGNNWNKGNSNGKNNNYNGNRPNGNGNGANNGGNGANGGQQRANGGANNQPAQNNGGAAKGPENGQTPADAKPVITEDTKLKLIKLLNNPCISAEDRKKMLQNINQVSEERAQQSINKLESLIADCEAAKDN